MEIIQHLPQDFSFEVPVSIETLVSVEVPSKPGTGSSQFWATILFLVVLAVIAFGVQWHCSKRE